MIIQFNWCEFVSISKYDIETPIVLLFALYVNRAYPIEKRMASSLYALRGKLGIRKFPSYLVNNNHLILHKHGVFSNYSCIEPQVYTTNCSFLISKHPPEHKRNYIYMLSQRNMHHRTNTIPMDYIEKDFYNNPFIQIKNNQITFPLEKNI
jgi:hypothetical protein